MNRTIGSVVVLAAAIAVAVGGCADGGEAQPRPPAPEAAVQTPLAPEEVGSLEGTRVRLYDTLDDVADDADLVVVGRVVARVGQLSGYPLPATESTVEIVDVLSGAVATPTIRLLDIGSDTVRMEDSAPPVVEGETYLLYLHVLGTYASASGAEVDGSDLYVSVLPAHYVWSGDGYVLDEPSIPDGVPDTVTQEQAAKSVE